MQLQWLAPWWLRIALALFLIVSIVWTIHQYRLTRPRPRRSRRRLLTLLRCLTLGVLLVLTAAPLLLSQRVSFLPAEVVIVVDDSASMGLVPPGETESRWRQALGVAAAIDSTLALHPAAPAVTLLRGGGTGELRPLDPTVDGASPVAVGSDPGGVVARVGEAFVGRPLRAIVLMGDGHATTTSAKGSGGGATATPAVFGLGVGDPVGPPDRLIRELRYPDLVWQGDEIVIEVGVASRQMPVGGSGPLRLTVSETGRPVAEVEAPAAEGLSRLEIVVPAGEPGLHVYDLQIAGLVNERFLENNRVTLAIDVREARSRLLLIGGRPDWNLRFLAQAAAAEQRLEAAAAYRTPTGLVLADSADVTGRLRPWQAPQTADEWLGWDAVAVCGDGGGDLDLGPLAEAVGEGLGLLWIAGETSGIERRRASQLDLLPVDGWWRPPMAGRWRIRPAAESASHPVAAGMDRSRFEAPPVAEVVAATVKGDAWTLLEAVQGRERELVAPLLVVDGTRRGHRAWLGSAELWRSVFWEPPGSAADPGEPQPRRLLRDLLVWLTADESRNGLTLVGGRTVYREGERIPVEARRRDLRGQAGGDTPAALRLRRLDGEAPERTFSLDAVPGQAGLTATTLPPLEPGRYEILPLETDGETGAGRTLVVTAGTVEDSQIRLGHHLRGVVRSLGGDYYEAGEAGARGALLEALVALPLAGAEATRRSVFDPAAGWPMLVVIVALLATEWYLRRRWDLL